MSKHVEGVSCTYKTVVFYCCVVGIHLVTQISADIDLYTLLIAWPSLEFFDQLGYVCLFV